MNKPLKQASKDFFAEHTLSQSQLDQLDAMLQQDEPIESVAKLEKPYFKMVSGFVAVAFVALFAFILFPQNSADLSYQIAKEVAKNHIKLKPLEVSGNQFNEVTHYFTELDFKPAPSQYFAQFQMDMLGGRYCSIQSVTAAQLRYQDGQGNIATLYEVGYNPDVFGEMPDITQQQPLIHHINGLEVQIWVEKGLLMASVKE